MSFNMRQELQTIMASGETDLHKVRLVADKIRQAVDPTVAVIEKFPVIGQYAADVGFGLDALGDLLDSLDDAAQAAAAKAAPPAPAAS